MTDVTLTHPDSKQEIDVDASMVPTYQSQGWEIKQPPKAVEQADRKVAK